MKIKITYTGGLDKSLDKKIEKFFEGLGYEFTGSGMMIAEQIRDITFERTEGMKPIKKFIKWLESEDRQNREIERYVEALLEEERNRLRKKVEGMRKKKPVTNAFEYTGDDGYNQAISDVLAKLGEKGK